jgi:hypothetical protein
MGLALFAGPIYVAAGLAALLRRRLAFVVTAKGKLRTTESLGTFRLHLIWAAFAAALLGASFMGHHNYTLLRVWSTLTLLTGIAPPIIAGISGLLASRQDSEQQPERTASSLERVQSAPAIRVMPQPAFGLAAPAFQIPAPRQARHAGQVFESGRDLEPERYGNSFADPGSKPEADSGLVPAKHAKKPERPW